eukprot:gnl/Chilomastix_cuspidata/4380.p1 GENE.gnl/Chilomastix_cuspidata/4380~~gnl/Chilomastix_cuspidata/4380.p1  ORF type:complete len:285 (-),score=52.32 gnl/Chilomastix_cuspidata/4380:700-1509(-)
MPVGSMSRNFSDILELSRVFETHASEVEPLFTDAVNAMRDYSVERNKPLFCNIFKTRLHSLDHSFRVAVWSMVLSELIAKYDTGFEYERYRSPLIWAAAFHDSLRVDDSAETSHGKLAGREWDLFAPWYASQSSERALQLPPRKDWKEVSTACRLHCGSGYRAYGDPRRDARVPIVARIIADADRLDRFRLSTPSADYMYLLTSDMPEECPARDILRLVGATPTGAQQLRAGIVTRFDRWSAEISALMSSEGVRGLEQVFSRSSTPTNR